MYRIALGLILLFSHPLFSLAQTTKPDMTVFGYVMGGKLSIPECPCKIAESKTGNGLLYTKHFKGYAYTTGMFTPVSSTCFERLDIGKYIVKKGEQLDSLPALTNGLIKVRFAPNDAPAQDLCPLGVFNAKIEDSKLAMISFDIRTSDAENVVEKLKKKYGPNVAVKNYQIQNGYGATLNYYMAVWAFPNLGVVLESSKHRILSDSFGTVYIELPQKAEQPKNTKEL
ncbi:hypothetical protein [Mucilaginibacter sp. SP1R1]|uniref:hypothetical protein n=1 Tax=Mucilaginibacter sp. SP1R1 TaxID=2723091 RepID=UPI001614F713|nr:hypothetical protein [Mucilaginibacter sp. SP1R1]MBB6152417.1 hypothetical protein [Mucilaginibacter sp. SP1R1]